MRVIKLGLISLVFFSIFLTLLSFLFPSRIRISKAIDIYAAKGDLEDYLRKPHTWYAGADSSAVFGTERKIAIQRTVDGTSIQPDTLPSAIIVEEALYPDSKRKGMGWNIIPHPGTPGMVTVQWYMDFKLKWYPWEKFSGLLLEKRYGPVMEKGLENLKALLEK